MAAIALAAATALAAMALAASDADCAPKEAILLAEEVREDVRLKVESGCEVAIALKA